MMEQSLFLERIENPIQLQSCLGKNKHRWKAAQAKLHQHKPQTATNHVSTTFMRNKEFIPCPFPEKRNERKEGRQAAEPEPGTRRSQKITMEHHPLPFERKRKIEGNKPRNPSWNKKEGGNHDGSQCHSTTETSPTTSWDQMEPRQMEQKARRLERHSQEPYPEPGNEDGTGCQKTRETIPGNLPETTRIEEMMTEQNARLCSTTLQCGLLLFPSSSSTILAGIQ